MPTYVAHGLLEDAEGLHLQVRREVDAVRVEHLVLVLGPGSSKRWLILSAKLGAHSRLEVLSIAIRQGLVAGR